MSDIETAPVVASISREERDLVFNALCLLDPTNAILGREYFVGDEDSCTIWVGYVGKILQAKVGKEHAEAIRLRKDDARRGIPASKTFEASDEARENLREFNSSLNRIRAEAEAKAAKRAIEREAKIKAKAEREAKELADAAADKSAEEAV